MFVKGIDYQGLRDTFPSKVYLCEILIPSVYFHYNYVVLLSSVIKMLFFLDFTIG